MQILAVWRNMQLQYKYSSESPVVYCIRVAHRVTASNAFREQVYMRKLSLLKH